MPFTQHSSFIKPSIGKPMSLERGHVDPAMLVLTFVYYEYKLHGRVWVEEERQQILEMNTHFRFDKRRGAIELLDHPFWHTMGLWRVADREEELLYKGQVKHPQRLEFDYEHYAPQQVKAAEYIDEIDLEAKARLGYDVPKYSIVEEESIAPFEWET